MGRRNGRDWTCTKSKKKEKNRRGKEDVRVSGVVGRDVTFSQRRIHVVNYFFVGWLIGESRNYAARTKRPLHCIGQRESGYATGKDRKNWTCSNSIFFFHYFFCHFSLFSLSSCSTWPLVACATYTSVLKYYDMYRHYLERQT